MNRKVLKVSFHEPVFAGGINLGAALNTQEMSTRWSAITVRMDDHGIYIRVKLSSRGEFSREHFTPMAMIKVAELEDEASNPVSPIKPKAA